MLDTRALMNKQINFHKFCGIEKKENYENKKKEICSIKISSTLLIFAMPIRFFYIIFPERMQWESLKFNTAIGNFRVKSEIELNDFVAKISFLEISD